MRAVHYFVRQMLQHTRLTWGGVVVVVVGRWLRACVVGQLDGSKVVNLAPGTWHLPGVCLEGSGERKRHTQYSLVYHAPRRTNQKSEIFSIFCFPGVLAATSGSS